MASSTFGTRLKYLRNRLNRTQDDVAKAIGTSRAAYSHLENGRNEPDNTMLIKLANYYGVTTDYLLGHKVDLGDVPVAAHIDGDLADLTEEERQEIRDYIEFKKAQYKKRHEKD
ncbi:helix-turn-helix domain-containing protein [Levilactobacillus brevis]|uniref:helix-turn-helix domain-containing protein n=1 Tax=Levilactobacillus brevis TaxID=1580 RepID=UPI00111AE3D2|nr:helix-turn-helix transcriptional regulator [Levilactobacillus brevis]QCZ50314.1 hypothetical protein SAC12_0736 [Levilactobacillus brevis]